MPGREPPAGSLFRLAGVAAGATPVGTNPRRQRFHAWGIGLRGRQTVVAHDQPADCLGQWRQVVPDERAGWRLQVIRTQARQPVIIAIIDQALQPVRITATAADERLEQPQGDPLVAEGIGQRPFAAQLGLERRIGLADVMEQRRHHRQQLDILGAVPVVLVILAQHVAMRGVGRHCALLVEAAGVTDDPQQLAAIAPAYPVAGHCRVAPGALLQQLAQGIQAGLGDGRLPGPLTTPLGELVEDAPAFHQRALFTLGDQQHVHRPISSATALRVSIMKSSDSLRVRFSMQA